jgi:hypothetical protein
MYPRFCSVPKFSFLGSEFLAEFLSYFGIQYGVFVAKKRQNSFLILQENPPLCQLICPPCPIPTKNGSTQQRHCLEGGSRAAATAMSGRQWQCICGCWWRGGGGGGAAVVEGPALPLPPQMIMLCLAHVTQLNLCCLDGIRVRPPTHQLTL